jgi:uncharacterized MAPEG superfamily protein
MSIAYWCVLAAALIPYAFTLYAKATPKFLQGDHNKNPREYEDALRGARKRAHWVQLNGFEAFPPFAAAVIIAHLTHAPSARIDTLALIFVAARLLYGMFYIANLDKLRSLVWFIGMASVIGLFLAGAPA